MNDDSSSTSLPVPPLLTKLVLFQFAALVIFSSWAFGGQSTWARQIIVWWGSVGIGLFIILTGRRKPSAKRWPPALALLWPLWLYDVLVGAGCFHPGFREVILDGQRSLVTAEIRSWMPSAALPGLAVRELWQFNGLVLTSFNLLLVISRRQQIRQLLFLLAGNAVVLAVFGTFQKLVGSSGLWFGAIPSPNEHFFATFIYHNHWGAFIFLHIAICLALLFHYARRPSGRGLLHSPVPLGVVITLLLATSIPLSTSRSCTVLAAGLLGIAFFHALLRLVRRGPGERGSVAAPVAALVVAAVIATAGIGWLARNVIAERSRLTSEQLTRVAQEGALTSRLVLYRDTWRMAAQKPWFGWGLESYAHVFQIFNTQRPVERWFKTPFYAEAHNDWLQSLAEVGFVGTALLGLLLLVPLSTISWRRVGSPLPRYLLGGCALLLLYAWLEFPFANPTVVLTFFGIFYGAIRYGQLEVRAGSADVSR